MTKAMKLELTWTGKESRINVEPRILLEDKEKSYSKESSLIKDTLFEDANTPKPTFDNMLIHGDNLLALKALEAEYVGKVKCIYIDPPYNTGNAFEHYDDGVEHSIWLSLMRDRLEILWTLLSDDGLLAIQIDDNEFARLYMLLIEICGEKNLKTICIKMSEASGLKMGAVKRNGTIPKLKEFLILAKKDGIKNIQLDMIPKSGWDKEYNIFLENFDKKDKEKIDNINGKENISDTDISLLDDIANKITLCSLADKIKEYQIPIQEKEKWCYKNSYRICQCVTSASILKLADNKKIYNKNPLFFVSSKRGEIAYFVRATYSLESKKPRLQLIFAEDNLSQHPGDLWTDIKTTGLDNEGSVDFKNGKKPEDLLLRIIKMNTKPGDLVLDSFLGSGTTCAVAHKMGRRWIGIEMGDHCYTHCIPRLQKVINGEDAGGITKSTNWQGGGGFKFYELGSSLIEKDFRGFPIISEKYNPEMLAEAMCKIMGYKYAPDFKIFWKQGIGTEKSYLFTTTVVMTEDYISEIEAMLGDNKLLICCEAFIGNSNAYKNIKIKKIPAAILNKCEWGKPSYPLPVREDFTDEDFEFEEEE